MVLKCMRRYLPDLTLKVTDIILRKPELFFTL